VRRRRIQLIGGLLGVWLAWDASALAATVTGNVALVGTDGRASKKRDYSGVVVWLEPVGGAPRPVSSPSSPSKQATMEQRNKAFVPRVLAVEVGTAVDFPNHDPIEHNAFSNHDGQVFDVHLYAPQTSRRVVFRRPGIVRVFCNIHETMSGVVAVLQTPYFAVSNAAGRFEMQAPAGEYTLHFWDERSQPDAVGKLARRVTIGAENIVLPETQIVAADQPLPPHQNKFGREYGQRPEDRVFYAGARR
jgi:plastocyanin